MARGTSMDRRPCKPLTSSKNSIPEMEHYVLVLVLAAAILEHFKSHRTCFELGKQPSILCSLTWNVEHGTWNLEGLSYLQAAD